MTACAPEPAPESAPVEMSPTQLLTRASLDLRGVRPTDAELAAVTDDPAALDGLLDGFVRDDRFPERLVAVYHEIYFTQTEGMDLRKDSLPVDNAKAFYWQVGQEPLRIVAQVAKEDLPYTTVVTADWTMANEELAAVFPVEWEPGATGWHKTRYTDGRPAGGVVVTNGLWWRYTSTEANANRRRANALTRILVCQDHLERPIPFDEDINLLDEAAVKDALHNDPSCVNCHVTLDPVAAHLFGFYWTNFTSTVEGTEYHAGKERLWDDLLDVAPGWFGTPTNGLVDLGAAIAGDPRFVTCAVQQAFERMLRRDATAEDTEALTALREQFLDGGLRLGGLYRGVVDLPAYRAGDVDAVGAVPIKLIAPDVLASSVADLTGYTWTRADAFGADVLRTDRSGVRALGGGVDGMQVTRAAPAPGATTVLVQEALADEASSYAVATERALAPADRRLFTETDFTETTAPAAQIELLHLRVLGRAPTADEADASRALFDAVYAIEGSVPLAWQAVLHALLRDPDFVLY